MTLLIFATIIALIGCVGGGSGTYSWGWVDTSAFGWEGEDCRLGPGPSGNFDICHDQVSSVGITLLTVATPDEVVANKTTLMTEAIANSGNVEFIIAANRDGTCWTFGGGSYYTDYGCAAMW